MERGETIALTKADGYHCRSRRRYHGYPHHLSYLARFERIGVCDPIGPYTYGKYLYGCTIWVLQSWCICGDVSGPQHGLMNDLAR